jgi:hypothetical protein
VPLDLNPPPSAFLDLVKQIIDQRLSSLHVQGYIREQFPARLWLKKQDEPALSKSPAPWQSAEKINIRERTRAATINK